jgi:hypothetical protein
MQKPPQKKKWEKVNDDTKCSREKINAFPQKKKKKECMRQ